MTLKELERAVAELTQSEFDTFYQYVRQLKKKSQHSNDTLREHLPEGAWVHPERGKTPQERRRIIEALEAELRADTSQTPEEMALMTAYINDEYIEEIDLSQWQD